MDLCYLQKVIVAIKITKSRSNVFVSRSYLYVIYIFKIKNNFEFVELSICHRIFNGLTCDAVSHATEKFWTSIILQKLFVNQFYEVFVFFFIFWFIYTLYNVFMNKLLNVIIFSGVGALRRAYGAVKRRGSAPQHFKKASGSVVRKALQTLEAIKWVESHPDGKGRILTSQVKLITSLIQRFSTVFKLYSI